MVVSWLVGCDGWLVSWLVSYDCMQNSWLLARLPYTHRPCALYRAGCSLQSVSSLLMCLPEFRIWIPPPEYHWANTNTGNTLFNKQFLLVIILADLS